MNAAAAAGGTNGVQARLNGLERSTHELFERVNRNNDQGCTFGRIKMESMESAVLEMRIVQKQMAEDNRNSQKKLAWIAGAITCGIWFINIAMRWASL